MRGTTVSYATPISHADATVHGDIEFLIPQPDRPFCYSYEPAADAAAPTTVFAERRVLIRNVRASDVLSLDDNGAALLRVPSCVRNFYDDDELQSRYYPESAEIIRAALGASRVIVFDHNVRRGAHLALHADRYDQGRPVHHAHTDYTETSALRRLQDELGPDARAAARGRVVQVNLWRPIRGPLRDAPLAICDGRSVGPNELVATDLLYPNRRGEIYYLTHDAGQRWYYAPDMASDEIWLFKNYDSRPRGAAQVAPHSAFEDPRVRSKIPPRESIEVRAFALFDA